MSHIVDRALLTKLCGGLSRLHFADENAVQWLANLGRRICIEKTKKYCDMSAVGPAATVVPVTVGKW